MDNERRPGQADMEFTRDVLTFRRLMTQGLQDVTDQLAEMKRTGPPGSPGINRWEHYALALLSTLVAAFGLWVWDMRTELSQVRDKQNLAWWMELEVKKITAGSEERAVRIDRVENAVKFWSERLDQQSKRLFEAHQRIDQLREQLSRCRACVPERGGWELPGLTPEMHEGGLGGPRPAEHGEREAP